MEIIVGAVVALITEVAARAMVKNPWVTRFVLILLSLVTAATYRYLSAQPYWQDVVQIMVLAGGFHALIIKPMIGAKTPSPKD